MTQDGRFVDKGYYDQLLNKSSFKHRKRKLEVNTKEAFEEMSKRGIEKGDFNNAKAGNARSGGESL